jgi:hypothetical protein
VGTRNLTLLDEECAASQVRNVLRSDTGGDFSEASTVTVSGNMKSLLAYVWLAGDGDDGGAADALAGADVLPPLPQPGNTSRASALTAATTASR